MSEIHLFASEQPDLLALHEQWPDRYPFLMESLPPGHENAARDILLGWPSAFLSQSEGKLKGQGWNPGQTDDFFSALDRWSRELRQEPIEGIPYCGGWFLLLGYELASTVEPRLNLPASAHRLPDALAVRCPVALIRDHQAGTTIGVTESAFLMRAVLQDCVGSAGFRQNDTQTIVQVAKKSSPTQFLQGVERALEYLRSGDIFQVNLSRQWYGKLRSSADIPSLYRRLRRNNPAPFAASIRWQENILLSSSPERLLRLDGRIAETRPIAGTHSRRGDGVSDQWQREQLIGSLKERAEHLMLIDLERNDLSRVCDPGSVEVAELMTLESYAHVHHIVSSVRGRIRSGIGPGETLRALFPGGTITGCPKVRAMEIIAELEGTGRGPYTGSIGYLSRCGRMDTNIIIRSILCEGCNYTLRAGAGIVADSDPMAELEETRIKAHGLLRALGLVDAE